MGAAVREARLQIRGATKADDPVAQDAAQRLRQLRLVQGGVDPTFSVSQPASLSTDPVGPPNWLIMVLAVVAGLTLATVAALLAEALVAGRDAPARGE